MDDRTRPYPLWVRVIDGTSFWVGRTVGYALALAPAVLLSYEVVARYVFNAPTRFTIELGLISQVMLAAAVAGYVLLENGHVGMDVISERLRRPWRQIVEIIGFFAGAVLSVVLAWLVWRSAMWSLTVNNVTETLGFRKAPLEIFFAGGMTLLALQFLAEARKRLPLRSEDQ